MIASITLYTLIWMISYGLMRYRYKLFRAATVSEENSAAMARRKLGFLAIIFISLLFVSYNCFITNQTDYVGSDRRNYIANFMGIRETPSQGLAFLIQTIRRMGGNIRWLYYFTTFICVFVTLYAYRISEEAVPQAVLLFFLSHGIVSTLVNLKQAYTNAFAALFFVLLLRNKGIRDNIFCLLLMILAILFHPVGFILIPVYFIVKVPKNKKTIFLFVVAIIAVVIFLKPILTLVAGMVTSAFPRLSSILISYLASTSGGMKIRTVAAAIVTGIPYYFIAFLGLVNRKRLAHKMDNYDNYLVISLMCAALYLISIYNQWFYRAIYLFYIPVFIFFCQMMMYTHNQGNRCICKLVVYGSISVITYRMLYLTYTMWGGF